MYEYLKIKHTGRVHNEGVDLTVKCRLRSWVIRLSESYNDQNLQNGLYGLLSSPQRTDWD